ncbi:MAG: lamin tail domain-containing protein, partial [Bacteroidetes bacterium]|nr:lamin tail domain-containing protein [Bacteroidota bacterium]
MRYLLLLMLLFVIPVREMTLQAQSAGYVVISEFATRGLVGNASGEFVECYNPVDAAVIISGWELQYRASTGSSYQTLATVPQGTVMPARSFFLFAGPTWDGTPAADMQWNSSGIADNATIRMVMATGEEVDRVAFGTGNDPEGSPAPHHGTTPNNNSVERRASAASTAASLAAGGAGEFAGNGWDSNDNEADFIVQIHGRNPQ